MNGFDDRFLTRNGLAARRLAFLLRGHEPGTRLPRVRDFAAELGCGNGTVQAALRLLEESGTVEIAARGHLGTFLVRADRAALWRLSGLGALVAGMPLAHSLRHEGLATGLRVAFEAAGTPFALAFTHGAGARGAALLDGRADLAVLSRLAADELIERHGGRLALVADLGPATYVGAHGLLLRKGASLDSPGLRVAVDRACEDQRLPTERAFAGRTDVEWVDCPHTGPRELFARTRADATVWNLDEMRGRLGAEVEVVPLSDEVTRDLTPSGSSAAVLARAEDGRAAAAVRDALDPAQVARSQSEVLRGDRMPSY